MFRKTIVNSDIETASAPLQSCSEENVLLTYEGNLQEKTHAEVWFQYNCKWAKIGTEIRFFVIFSSLVY